MRRSWSSLATSMTSGHYHIESPPGSMIPVEVAQQIVDAAENEARWDGAIAAAAGVAGGFLLVQLFSDHRRSK